MGEGIQWGGQEATTIAATAGFGGVTGLARSVLGRLGLAAGEGFLSPDIGQRTTSQVHYGGLAENPDKAPKKDSKDLR